MALTAQDKAFILDLQQKGVPKDEIKQRLLKVKSSLAQEQAKVGQGQMADAYFDPETGLAKKTEEGFFAGMSPAERRAAKKLRSSGYLPEDKEPGILDRMKTRMKTRMSENYQETIEAGTRSREGMSLGEKAALNLRGITAAGATAMAPLTEIGATVGEWAMGKAMEAGENVDRLGTQMAGTISGALSPSKTIEQAQQEIQANKDYTKEKTKEFVGEKVQQAGEWYEKQPQATKDVLASGANLLDVAEGVPVVGAATTGFRLGSAIIKGLEKQLSKKAIKYAETLPETFTKDDLLRGIKEEKLSRMEAEVIAKKYDIELPASATSSGVFSKFEQYIGEGFFGGKIKERVEKATRKFDEIVQKTIDKAKDVESVGKEISTATQKTEKRYREVKNSLYQSANEIEQAGRAKIRMPEQKESVTYIDELLARKRTAAEAGIDVGTDIKTLEALQGGLQKSDDFAVWREAEKEIAQKAGFNKLPSQRTPEEKMFGELYHKIQNDMDNGIKTSLPQLAETIETANSMYKEFQFIKNKPFWKSIERYERQEDYSGIAKELTKTNRSPEDVRLVYEILDEPTQQIVQERIVADILNKSKSATGEGITPTGISGQLKNIKNAEELIGVENVQLLKDLDKLAKAVARSSSVSSGSQTAILQKLISATLFIPTAGKALGAEFLLAKILGSKKGQQFMKRMKPEQLQALEKRLEGVPLIATKPRRLMTQEEINMELDRIKKIKEETLSTIKDEKLRNQFQKEMDDYTEMLMLPEGKTRVPTQTKSTPEMSTPLKKAEDSAILGDDLTKTKMTAPKELIEDVETTASKMKKEGKTFDDFLNKYNGLVDDFSSLRQKRHKLHARQDIDTAESQLEEIADIVENIYKKTGIAGDEALYVKNLNKKINNTMMDDEYFDFENASITQKGQDKLDEFIEEMNESVELYMREFENITGIKDLAPSGIARNREFGGQANYVSKGNLTIDEWLNDIWKQANQATSETSLIQEAKKYKSAEEFVKAQGTPVYHGTNYSNARIIQKEGINPESAGAIQEWMKGRKYSFFTGDEKYAQSYGIQKGGGDTKSGRSFVLAVKSPKDIQIEPSTFNKGMKFPDLVSQQKISPEDIYIKGIDNKWYPIKEFNFFTGESDTFVGKTKLNELPIKTKSQLEDIWKQAHNQSK